jgi:hypothetical protein
MRNRWLRDAFGVRLSSSTNAMPNSAEKCPILTQKDSVDEDEAVRLLGDYGISEELAKVRLQVNASFPFRIKKNIRCSFTQELQTKKSDDVRGYFSTEELVSIFKRLSTRPEIYHLLVRSVCLVSTSPNPACIFEDTRVIKIFFQCKI